MSRCPAKRRSAAWTSRPDGRSLQAWKDEKAELLQQRVDVMKQATELRAQARQVPLGPHRGGQHGDHRGGAELARQLRYPHPADSREGCRPGGPLRILPPGNARAGVADQGGDGRRGGLHQPSEQGTAEDPRSGEVRLHALPRRQRRGARRAWRRRTGTTNSGCGRCTTKRISKPAASSATSRKSSPRWPTRSTRAARFSACAAAWAAIATKASTARPTRLSSVNQQIRQLEQQKAEWKREAGFSDTEGRQSAHQRRRSEEAATRTPTI